MTAEQNFIEDHVTLTTWFAMTVIQFVALWFAVSEQWITAFLMIGMSSTLSVLLYNYSSRLTVLSLMVSTIPLGIMLVIVMGMMIEQSVKIFSYDTKLFFKIMILRRQAYFVDDYDETTNTSREYISFAGDRCLVFEDAKLYALWLLEHKNG